MAFLGDLGNFLSGSGGDALSSILRTVSGVRGLRQTNKAARQYNVPTAGETRSNALYEALVNPNDPTLAMLTQQEKAANLARFLTQLREMQLADRREGAMGRRGTFFNPERADETMSFLTSRGLPMMDALSAERAQSRLAKAAGGFHGQVEPQAERLGISRRAAEENAAINSQVPNQILDIFRRMNTNTQAPVTTGYINRPAQEVFGNIHWG